MTSSAAKRTIISTSGTGADAQTGPRRSAGAWGCGGASASSSSSWSSSSSALSGGGSSASSESESMSSSSSGMRCRETAPLLDGTAVGRLDLRAVCNRN